MSLATIRDPMLRELGLDETSGLIADVKTRLLDMINESIVEINIITDWNVLKTAGTITLVDGTSVYTLATNAHVNSILYNKFYIDTENAVVNKAEREDVFQKDVMIGGTGMPQQWVPYGVDASNVHQVKLYPTPAAAQDGVVLDYFYTKIITALSAETDTTPVQEAVIRNLAMAKYHEYDQDFNTASSRRATANFLINKMAGKNRRAQRFVPLTSKNISYNE